MLSARHWAKDVTTFAHLKWSLSGAAGEAPRGQLSVSPSLPVWHLMCPAFRWAVLDDNLTDNHLGTSSTQLPLHADSIQGVGFPWMRRQKLIKKYSHPVLVFALNDWYGWLTTRWVEPELSCLFPSSSLVCGRIFCSGSSENNNSSATFYWLVIQLSIWGKSPG